MTVLKAFIGLRFSLLMWLRGYNILHLNIIQCTSVIIIYCTWHKVGIALREDVIKFTLGTPK